MIAAMEKLGALRIVPLRMRLETLEAFSLPKYKGALFRGGFGQFFRDIACRTREPRCGGCAHAAECPYSLVFESPVVPANFAVLKKYPYAPHPFVLTPPLDARTFVPSGAALELGLTLIGPGVEFLPHFIYVFERMGQSGRYGGRFRVAELVSGVEGGARVYDGGTRRIVRAPAEWQATAEEAVSRLRLEFVTPLRIRTGGRYNASPDFAAVAQSLLRRVHLLSAIYGGGDGDGEWMRPLLAQADAVITERSEFRLFRWERTSGREGRRIAMDGVLGWLAARGELTELAPYFQAAEWLQVGSGTSMGMGKCRVKVVANDR